MGRKLIIAFFGLVVVIGVWYLLVSAGGGANEAEMAQLRQRDAKRRAAAQEAERRSKTDLALLAKQGRGQELPEYLVSEIDREGNFWFVGKSDSVAGGPNSIRTRQSAVATSDHRTSSRKSWFFGGRGLS